MRTPILLAVALLFVACKKEDTRSVTYKAECQHCILTYTDGSGSDVTETVDGNWSKRITMTSGEVASIGVCGFNNPLGGSINDVNPHNGNAVWIFLDNNTWSETSESTWGATLDSAQVGSQWRKFYADTCASTTLVVPKR